MMHHYQLHGLDIRTVSDDPAVARMLHRVLRHKGGVEVSDSGAIDLTLDFSVNRLAASLPETARYLGISEHGDIGVWMASPKMMLRRGKTTVTLCPDTHTARAAVAAGLSRTALFYLISLSLVILLRYRGWYALHTAALAQGECGLLLAAQSESGKTTAALTMVRDGWTYLSDDTVLLHAVGDRVQAHSFRRAFCVDASAAAHFPELAAHEWPTSLSDPAKWRVDVDRLYPGRFAPSCTPHVLVLPEIADAPTSRVESVEAKTVLAHLVDQGAFFLTPEPAPARRHLAVFRQLIAQSRLYRLRAGRDVLETPGALSTLLAPLLD